MIVRELGDGRLLCINQTTHALQATSFCRRWGNADFAPPDPYEPVMAGIFLHDNGWSEWEEVPEVRDDGYPMDFVHGPHWATKVDLWRRGVARAFAQHPYAGTLVMRHAAILYRKALASMPPDERAGTEQFLAEQELWEAKARRLLCDGRGWAPALTEEAIEAHTRLLQVGDALSLLVAMPWSHEARLTMCPTDPAGGFTDLVVAHGEGAVVVDPWPYGTGPFEVAVHGRLLERDHFAGHEEYRAALAAAPLQELRWTVSPR
jgi:hypothetical protein